jgi:aspartyl/asparaginyl-tRNA synthetase
MGCNQMTCSGCKAHIRWVYMDIFEISDHCYKYMNGVHGGIGLGLERFMD